MNASILKQIERYCDENKYRLTRPRIEVLKIISSNKKPLGAYEILDALGQVIENPKPPTVYRAIEFWQTLGFVHRIESLNAFALCKAGHRHKGSQFMICDDCGSVTETHLCGLPDQLKNMMTAKNFTPAYWNLEIHGMCEHCASRP